jgi:hypothetical protein
MLAFGMADGASSHVTSAGPANPDHVLSFVVDYFGLPLAPVGLSLLFRSLGQLPSAPWWWCTEIPFFTLAMCAATYKRCIVQLDHHPNGIGNAVFASIKLLVVLLGIGSLTLMGIYYTHTHIVEIDASVRRNSSFIQVAAAIIGATIGFSCFLYEARNGRQRAQT